MAITSVPQFVYPNWVYHGTAGLNNSDAFNFNRMNASGHRMAFVVRAPKAGTLKRFICHLFAVSNNPDNGIRLSFQDVNTSTGVPDGTQDQYRDITGTISAGFQTPGIMSSDGTDGGVKRTVVLGEFVCCVVDFVNFVASDSIDVTWFLSQGFFAVALRDAYFVSNGSKRGDGTPCLALEYDDGTYGIWDNGTSIGINDLATYASNSNPDEHALRFKMPYTCSMTGFAAMIDVEAAVDVVLYNAAGTVLDTVSYNANQRVGTNGGFFLGTWPAGPHTLTSGVEYKISIKPTTTTSISLTRRLFPSSAYLASTTEGVEFYLATRVDGGAWSTDQTRRPVIHLIIDGIELTTTGGGGGATARASAG